MWNLLYGNYSTLSTKLGGGNHGNIGIIMQDMIYEKILPTPYNAPMDPGGTTQVPSQATMAVRLQLQDKHAK